MKKLTFPEGFLWGSGTSAHQVEGNNTQNDWYVWEQMGRVPASGLACDHYNQYRGDIDLLASLNQNAYRFSIEWSRIEPKERVIVEKEIQHYRNVLEYLKSKGIKTFLTLHHFTSPTWFHWDTFSGVEQFARFSELVAKRLGDLVDFWCTINEPNVVAKHGYALGDFPPGEKTRDPGRFFQVLEKMMSAHNRAYEVIHGIHPDAVVGVVLNNEYFTPHDPNSELDRHVVTLNRYIWNHHFLDHTRFDFIGLNYYGPKQLMFDPDSPGGYTATRQLRLDKTDMGWEVDPEGLYHVLSDLKRFQKPVYITENGLADANDKNRIQFIREHLKALHTAIDAGVDVRGYLYWSLMDNFEWTHGFAPRFGLIEMDYATQERKVRESARWYAEVARTNTMEI